MPAAASSTAPSTGSPPAGGGRRPNPQWAQVRRTLYFLTRNSLAVVGLAIVVFFVFVAIYGAAYPASSTQMSQYCGTLSTNGEINASQLQSLCGGHVLCTYAIGTPAPGANCYAVSPENPNEVGPTWDLAHFTAGPLPFGSLALEGGTNYFLNTFLGLLKGAQWSLGISAGIVGSGALIGLLLGATAGYFGGYVDEVMMRITDIFLAIPGFLLVIVALASIGADITTFDGKIALLMGAFILTWWPIYTRIVRGQVLVTREQKYVEASRASGAGHLRIVTKHIIPNSLYPVFVQMSLDVGSIPIALGGIAFLGFNIFPLNFPEWGTIAASATGPLAELFVQCSIGTCYFPWWQLLFPGLVLFLFAISVNFLSDGLRDALDPRLRR